MVADGLSVVNIGLTWANMGYMVISMVINGDFHGDLHGD